MSEPRFAIIVSRFNETVTGRLLAGAEACFADHGFKDAQVSVYFVPGAWELPVATLHAARAGFTGIVAIGCVVRGDTPHFDYVAGGAADGLARAGVETGVPIAFGVLTTETMDQALDRAGGKHGNKGYEAAQTVLEMVDLIGRIEEERASTQ
jgi:6,7-dimethyl-8-ribityllumazine synthase